MRAFDAARFAPQGGNRQPVRWVVVRDAGLRRALRDLYLPVWKRYLEQHERRRGRAPGPGRLPPTGSPGAARGAGDSGGLRRDGVADGHRRPTWTG